MSVAPELHPQLVPTLRRYWGFDTLRPLQHEAVAAALDRRDSLVILPTGGGKSLCYQLPPLLRAPGEAALCVVVSPLIALMKDQVDGLRLAGYPAAALYGTVSAAEGAEIRRGIEQGRIRLLYVSPERLLMEGFLSWLSALGRYGRDRAVAAVAIDEAHCISQWGHDFRPEYRRLAELRDALPGVPVHATTATATPRVQEDIVAQLRMVDPAIHVGTFDRPNLSYRVLPRVGQGEEQIRSVLQRRAGEAAIVYCLSRRQTEAVAQDLVRHKVRAAAYHAGLPPQVRASVQEDFISERLDVVVATVAFGMGIDRGDVRAVIHASMPRSVEAYQQETGRAGRDGLPAECVLLYSSADAMRWGQLAEKSAAESTVEVPPEVLLAQQELTRQMQQLASGMRCRHRALSEYFGQPYTPPRGGGGCNACDVCNQELEEVEDATTVARKILSCVARLRGSRGDSFGAAYIAEILRGSKSKRVLERGHQELSTWGLLPNVGKDTIVSFIDQLVDLGALSRDGGKYPVIRIEGPAGPILRGEEPVHLLRARAPEVLARSDRKRRRVDGSRDRPLSAQEAALFEVLRKLRREIATELKVPPYIVFGDAPLQEMARARPATLTAFSGIKGVGGAKLEQFGERFVGAIDDWCAAQGGVAGGRAPPAVYGQAAARPPSEARVWAFAMFEAGEDLDTVATAVGRTRTTVGQYLVEWIRQEVPPDLAPWVSEADYDVVAEVSDRLGHGRLKPIFETLGGAISYESIRLVVAHRGAIAGE